MSRRVVIVSSIFVGLVFALVCGVLAAQTQGPGPGPGPGEPNAVRFRPIPVLKYTVASPRACLIGPPSWSDRVFYLPAGDADNFPRKNGAIRVPIGTRVVFCLSRDMEGVWYTGSYGCLGTSLILQYCKLCPSTVPCQCPIPDPCNCPADGCARPCARCRCEQCTRLGAVCPCPCPDSNAVTTCPWVTIGKDGARDCRKGPSIGRARVGVPVQFKRPGVYLLRAIVHTFAKPGYPLPLDQWRERLASTGNPTAVLPEIPIAEDKDVIYVRVHVLDLPIADIEPDDELTEDPDVKCIRPIPKDVDPNEPSVDPGADLNGDEMVNLADLAILGQQWGRPYEMPFADDE